MGIASWDFITINKFIICQLIKIGRSLLPLEFGFYKAVQNLGTLNTNQKKQFFLTELTYLLAQTKYYRVHKD